MTEHQQHLGFKSTWVKGPSSWLRLCLDCRDVSGSFGGLSILKTHSFPVKKQPQHTMTLASSIQNSKMQYWKWNRLRNPSAQYSIGYQKFAVRYTIPCLQLGVYLLQTSLTLVSGSIFSIYTSLPWFIHNIYFTKGIFISCIVKCHKMHRVCKEHFQCSSLHEIIFMLVILYILVPPEQLHKWLHHLVSLLIVILIIWGKHLRAPNCNHIYIYHNYVITYIFRHCNLMW